MDSIKIYKYFNRKQLEAMTIAAKDEVIVAARGFGKSEGIDAPRLIRNVHEMPRSSGALLSPTYGKLLRNTLPAIFHALDRLGYKRNVHYVVGHKPAKMMNFKSAYIAPFNYDYVISWYNGSIQHLISFDRPMSANSMSLDYVMGFEAKFLDYQKIVNEVLPANRGNKQYFGDCPWHHGSLYTSDMPTNKIGDWILNKEKEMDSDLIDLIRDTYAKIKNAEKTLAEEKDSTKVKNISYYINKLRKELQFWRSKALFYAEYDAFDNIEILGEDFIKQLKRDLPPLIFQTAVLNIRMRKIDNGFYSALNEKIHYYTAFNNSHFENLNYDTGEAQKNTCKKDGDILQTQPLIIANDYNASINTMVTAQKIGRELRTLSSFFVKTPRKIKELMHEWADYYHDFAKREVVYYYDSTAIAEDAAGSETFADIVISTLRKRGWSVYEIYIGNPMRHNLKHIYIDLALKGDENYLFPTFNQDNNEYLLLAMEQTGIKIGRNGFEKDKSAEKKADTTEQPDEQKTHITDAWDTLFIGCTQYPINSGDKMPTGIEWN
ncbi:MAG: hypothetical protein WCK02_16150 [Bacteroidota bacterium]